MGSHRKPNMTKDEWVEQAVPRLMHKSDHERLFMAFDAYIRNEITFQELCNQVPFPIDSIQHRGVYNRNRRHHYIGARLS